MLARHLDEFFQGFHGSFEFLGEFFVFLVGPGITEGGEASVEHAHAVFKVAVETLEFVGEPADFFGIHYCLGHRFFAFRLLIRGIVKKR